MTIRDLVQKYHQDRDTYLKPDYNETQLRVDFVDPLFELLGWDIKNGQGKSTNEREVLVEEGLRADIDSNVKKPDYTFRLFAERKFFLEAKKPHVKIDTDPIPARQIRRYGFTSKLKISALCNFEYLAIYDCSQLVDSKDMSTKARISLYHYTQYEAAFDEIRKQLGHESVYSGEFDNTWKDIEQQIKLNGVDDLFLKQINQWRIILGKEVWSHKEDLDEIQLNDIVQRYINSIIFLRVCEDRNLEVYKTLLNFATQEDFNALIDLFHQADRKYNAGLFNHPLTIEIIKQGGSAFWTIINQLYFPESIYSFAVFSSDILGNIYEIFLGEQLKIRDGEIVLEKKPENVDRDIVTTPTFVIRDILKETVAQHCVGKTDTEIFDSTFADIACGSGAFLLETYQLLHDTLVDYYLENNPQELIQTGLNSYKLKFELKKKIVTNCIFGIDKDFNAVEACKFGLLLKLLENEDHRTIPTPALPSLDDNINYGNSLLDSSMTSPANQHAVNPFDFGVTKFDVIVGNPPYMATEHMKQFTPMEFPLYKAIYSSAYKQFDKYFLFIQRGFELLKPNGMLGYIAPSKLAKVGAARLLRRLLVDNRAIYKIVGFGANQIFEDKTTYTCLLFLKKEVQQTFSYLEVQSLNAWQTRNIELDNYDVVAFNDLDDEGWVLVPGHLKPAYELIEAQSATLETLVGSENIYNGIQTSANNIYIHNATHEDDRYFYFQKDGLDWQIEKKLTRPYFKTTSGQDNLNTYRPFLPNAFVIYPYLKINNNIQFVEINKLESDYPHAYTFLNHYKGILSSARRDIKPTPETPNEWYRYGRHQSLDKCDVPAKIIVGVLSQGDKYAIDYHGTLISSGGTAGYCMITLPPNFSYSIYYIQALLNSKYLEWFSALLGEVFRGGYIARGTKVLKRLPIRIINFAEAREKELHDNIAITQETLIRVQGEIDKNRGNRRELIPMLRRFDMEKKKLDTALKTLYNLGEQDNLIPLISKLYATD